MSKDESSSKTPHPRQPGLNKYNIAIVEDDLITRQVLSDHFATSERLQCVLIVDTIEKFLRFHRDFFNLHLVLLDIRLYDKSGIDGIPSIRAREPEAEIVMFTAVDDYDAVFRAVCNGATGYLLKDLPPHELENRIIETLDSGGALLSPSVAKRIVRYFNPGIQTGNPETKLTHQESTVVRLLTDGFTYEAIAGQMGISINGVRYHVKNVYRKLHVKSRAELMRKGYFSE
ncbi:MAG: response regulator transcription factor [Saprospiraceae bacterium]|nr:response regulator transcription factor [Saprospiraceae bacterium]